MTSQYSVTEYASATLQTELSLPAVWFLYDLSPITVTITETRRSLLHLLVRFCAVVGGVFAVTGRVEDLRLGFWWKSSSWSTLLIYCGVHCLISLQMIALVSHGCA